MDYYAQLKTVSPTVSRETADRLLAFQKLFIKWNTSINLASPSTIAELWQRHIMDSAQLYELVLSRKNDTKNWLDIGSGGGFPGIVLGCMMKENAGSQIILVESVVKKAAFLRTATGNLDIPVEVYAERIEMLWDVISTPDVITARALASLNKLFSLTEPWMRKGAVAFFQKGRDYQREIDETLDEWDYDLIKHISVVDDNSVILEIRNLSKKATNSPLSMDSQQKAAGQK
ncbi:16S rRNA (guanine(527)-N(7))-methyltransferase RsmG [Brucellaceae bacterium C25G]